MDRSPSKTRDSSLMPAFAGLLPTSTTLFPSADNQPDAYDQPTSPINDLSLIRHLKIFRFFGFLPFKLSLPSIGGISKPFLCVSAVYSLSMLCYSSSRSFRTAGIAVEALVFAQLAMTIITPFLSMTNALYRRHDFGDVVIKLIALQTVLDLKKYPMFRTIKWFSAASLLTIASVITFRTVRVALKSSPTSQLINEITSTILVVGLLSALAQFTYLANCLSACFKKLSSTIIVGRSKTSVTQYLRTHNQIADLAMTINGIYNFVLSGTLFLSFGSIINMMSYTYTGKKLGDAERIRHVAFALFPIGLISHILHSCQSVTDWAEASNKALLDFRLHSNGRSFEDNILLLHYSGKKPLTFKVFSSIAINYNLGVSMLATFLTYTIVLYQSEVVSNCG
ncbi:Hypothetical protein NTJ_14478 [Nesidiocoris tenuis]|uniref:Gustatory receptor n=1 Tax=Nesidiocoris tenuis TaxID=355587 RepID=A0ABN7BBF1_9HEMI|nr:Hypothetical protein NTJ_14478 [Nesidiocoris tenuis]